MSLWLSDPDVDIHVGDALAVLRGLPDGCVDCCVTSPPYWGLRDYGTDGQLDLEASPDEYVAAMVAVFAEVRRVLADRGTLWLNIGDSYISGQGGRQSANGELPSTSRFDRPDPKPRPDLPNPPSGWAERAVTRRTYPAADSGLKPKDLAGMPWRLAFALQADGWWLRSDIVWAKPNPMPESVTDRPTKAHEMVFLLAKRPSYYFDAEAVREPAVRAGDRIGGDYAGRETDAGVNGGWLNGGTVPSGRNVRSVWEIATQPYPDAHFATFPEELPRRCILAGCPEWVCASCGKARERIVGDVPAAPDPSQRTTAHYDTADRYGAGNGGNGGFDKLAAKMRAGVGRGAVGWSDCGHGQNWRPGTVLDPFLGSGTTAHVARKHGRKCVGIELNPAYAELAARRLQQLSLLADGAA